VDCHGNAPTKMTTTLLISSREEPLPTNALREWEGIGVHEPGCGRDVESGECTSNKLLSSHLSPSVSCHEEHDEAHGGNKCCPPGWKRGRRKISAGKGDAWTTLGLQHSEEAAKPARSSLTHISGGSWGRFDNQRRAGRSCRCTPVGSTFNEALVFWDEGSVTEECIQPVEDYVASGKNEGLIDECDGVAEAQGGCLRLRANTRESVDSVDEFPEDECDVQSPHQPLFSFFQSRKLFGEQGKGYFQRTSEEERRQRLARYRSAAEEGSARPRSSNSEGMTPMGCNRVHQHPEVNDEVQPSQRQPPPRRSPRDASAIAKQQHPKVRVAVPFLKRVRYAHLESVGARTMPREETDGPVVYRGHREEELERRAVLEARRKREGVPLCFHPMRAAG